MKRVELYQKVRHAVLVKKMSRRCAARYFGIDRKTVDKMLVLSAPPPHGRIGRTFSRKLEGLTDFIDQILIDDRTVHTKQHHTVVRIFERLRDERGFTGGETIVREYVALQKRRTREVFVPLYDFYQTKILECDRKLEIALKALEIDNGHDTGGLPKVRTKTRQVNTPDFEVRSALYRVLGVDLTQIHGIGPALALKLVGECGTDLAAWPSSKHFTSWLCLAPGNKISGGKLLSSKTRRSSSRAAALLRLAATTIGRSDTALGAFYRRLSARAGKAKAVTATARKIAVLFYNSLRYGMAYHDPGASQYEERYRSRVVGNLQRRAKAFGFTRHEMPAEPDMPQSAAPAGSARWAGSGDCRWYTDESDAPPAHGYGAGASGVLCDHGCIDGPPPVGRHASWVPRIAPGVESGADAHDQAAPD